MFYVYLIQCGDSNYYKIGVSENVCERVKSLQMANPFTLRLIIVASFGSQEAARSAETDAHHSLRDSRIHGEWFELTPLQAAQLTLEMEMVT